MVFTGAGDYIISLLSTDTPQRPLAPYRSMNQTNSGSAQGRFSSAHVCSGLLTLFTRHGVGKTYLTRNYQLLTRGAKRFLLLRLGILDMLLLFIYNYTDRRRDSNSGSSFPPPIHFPYRLYILKIAVSSRLCNFPLYYRLYYHCQS